MIREMDTPIGRIYIVAQEGKVSKISLRKEEAQETDQAERYTDAEEKKPSIEREILVEDKASIELVPLIEDKATENVLEKAARELEEYFRGERRTFDVPIKTQGTTFEEKVWKALREIPYGVTCSYGEIAEKIGSPKGARAVGGACGRNPLLIVTPCHRVVGSKGNLTGFTGGLDIKEKLLKLEGI